MTPKTKKALKQLKYLERLVSNHKIRLAAEWKEKWKILISTILASQSRDVLTNKISAILYERYNDPKALGNASLSEIKRIIRPINYYKTKAKHIKETAKIISEKGIPKTREKLMKLPGVGRKVANVYLAEAHNAAEIGIDTHVFYIAHKLGWTKNKKVEDIEQDLKKLFPKRYWRIINYVLVSFGQIYRSRGHKDKLLSQIKRIKS